MRHCATMNIILMDKSDQFSLTPLSQAFVTETEYRDGIG